MNKTDVAIYIIFVLILVTGGAFWLLWNGNTVDNTRVARANASASSAQASLSASRSAAVSSAVQAGLVIEDVEVGTGAEVLPGSTVKVYYQGFLADGNQFDGNFDFGTKTETRDPIEFSLNGVIQGWQDGIPGMKVGGTRKLTIPPQFAYGEQGSGSIPGNATLTFTVKVLDTK